jgi:hypothetical protein
MEKQKKYSLTFVAVLALMFLTHCQTPSQPLKPVDKDTKIEPMIIKKIESFGDITEDMWDETYNTFLVLKIHRLAQIEYPDAKSTFEIQAEIPLYAQHSGESAGVYGKGESEATVIGMVTGVGATEGSWGIKFEVLGYINPSPDCGLELKIDEEWLEGSVCTTALGITNCETNEADKLPLAYGIVEFPYITGMASNIDNLNMVEGSLTLETSLEVIPTGEQVINLPDVPGCDLDIED